MLKRVTSGRARTAFISACIAAVAVQLAAAPARAADPSPASSGAAAEPSAEQLADDAYKLHAAGKYAEAISLYVKAYEISNAGATLYNVATIYDRKLHEPELAVEFYRRYLRAGDAEPQWIEKATERITALKAQESEERARLTASVAPAPAPSDTKPAALAPSSAPVTPPGAGSPAASGHGSLRTAGIVVGATGLAGVGASVILGLVAKGKNDDANTLCNGAACSSARGVTLAQQAGSFATASTVAFFAGLGLAGAGTVMYLVSPKRSASAGLTVEPQIGTTGGAMILRGRF
jgi:tetratricopeptide (TPR) repeat protein